MTADTPEPIQAMQRRSLAAADAIRRRFPAVPLDLLPSLYHWTLLGLMRAWPLTRIAEDLAVGLDRDVPDLADSFDDLSASVLAILEAPCT